MSLIPSGRMWEVSKIGGGGRWRDKDRAHPSTLYRVELDLSWSKHMGVNRCPKRTCERWCHRPRPLGIGRSWPHRKTFLTCVISPNLVAMGQTVRAYVLRSAGQKWPTRVAKFVFLFAELSRVPRPSHWAMFLLSGGAVSRTSVASLPWMTDSKLWQRFIYSMFFPATLIR